MSLTKKIVCGVLVTLVLCVAGVTVWQWQNIKPIFVGLVQSSEEIEQKLQQNDQARKDAIQSIPNVTVRDLTDEERQALKDGTVSKAELIQTLTQPVQPPEQTKPPEQDLPEPDKPVQPPVPDPDGEAVAPPAQPEPAPQDPPDDYTNKVSEIVAEVCVLREEFLIRLDDLMKQALKEYSAIRSGKQSGSISGMVSDYLSQGLAMEKECDAQVEAIVARLEAVLQENGGDISIADTVLETYVNEKSLKKAWYMAELKKRGLI